MNSKFDPINSGFQVITAEAYNVAARSKEKLDLPALVILSVIQLMQKKGKSCTPSISWWMNKTLLDESTTRRRIQKLVKARLIVQRQRAGRTAEYRLAARFKTLSTPCHSDGDGCHGDGGGGVTVKPIKEREKKKKRKHRQPASRLPVDSADGPVFGKPPNKQKPKLARSTIRELSRLMKERHQADNVAVSQLSPVLLELERIHGADTVRDVVEWWVALTDTRGIKHLSSRTALKQKFKWLIQRRELNKTTELPDITQLDNPCQYSLRKSKRLQRSINYNLQLDEDGPCRITALLYVCMDESDAYYRWADTPDGMTAANSFFEWCHRERPDDWPQLAYAQRHNLISKAPAI